MNASAKNIASGCIDAVHVGKVAALPGTGRLTAFIKTPAAGPVAVHDRGLDGDQQANRNVHGGPEKAVYGYPVANYAGWRVDMPDLAERFVAGAMGENLVVSGLDERSVHIGDIVRCGTALLQVSQLREPCSVFAAVFGTARVVRAMTRSGRCGWYYRVLEPGHLAAGDLHAIIDRPNPGWPVSRFAVFAAGRGGTIEALQELTTLPGLTPGWRLKASKALVAQQPVRRA